MSGDFGGLFKYGEVNVEYPYDGYMVWRFDGPIELLCAIEGLEEGCKFASAQVDFHRYEITFVPYNDGREVTCSFEIHVSHRKITV